MITPIINVNNTPNKNISFGNGVQSNYGLKAPSARSNMVEGNIITGFVGTVCPSLNQIESRANSIEKGLNGSKLNFFA